MSEYDCIIIGGGVAALSGALYLGRYQRKALLLADTIGGQTAIAGTIENYPGFESINGADLISKIKSQVLKLKSTQIEEGVKIESLSEASGSFEIKGNDKTYRAKSVLIATGKRHRKLGLDGEGELTGKGVSYCATCDGPFAKGKKAVVVGGGNSAVEATQILSKVADRVYLVNINEKLSGEKVRIEQIESDKKIEILPQTTLVRLLTDNKTLSGVRIKNRNGNESMLECQMIFIEIGWIPNSETFAQIVNLNEEKEIIIDPKTNQTSQRGIFAAGDITDVPAKQIVVAAGEGAKAAIAINQFLENLD
ncbi:MAG: NAD(P)/FAD-dependent oxidoreductase [Candidatus Berkelbacteria bacterium]|nr:NAD(P)/FAD-dependent oxidoreductase [Candidatus Berkelbacteria bacterium]